MPELVLTLESMHKAERRKQKFMAAMQGIDLDENSSENSNSGDKKISTLEEVQARAVARLTGDQNLAGAVAAGLTPDMGIQYEIMEGTISG